ncbi:MAG: hypothetical protein KGO02_20995 [Alphaproteobacteria bacterium]|nr:hypothetical protein [Alphaproteobacteria bacterium]
MKSEEIHTEKPADAKPKALKKARLRTLADLDRRTSAARVAFELRDSIAADLGGFDHLTAMQRELVENTAVLGAMLKDAAASYLSGDPVDLAEFMALTNAQRRLLADLGLERRAHDLAPDLQRYVAAKAKEAA